MSPFEKTPLPLIITPNPTSRSVDRQGTPVIIQSPEGQNRRFTDLVAQRSARVGSNALLSSAESPKILGRSGDDIFVELDDYPSLQLSSNAYV